jgi:hypothetical protein
MRVTPGCRMHPNEKKRKTAREREDALMVKLL